MFYVPMMNAEKYLRIKILDLSVIKILLPDYPGNQILLRVFLITIFAPTLGLMAMSYP